MKRLSQPFKRLPHKMVKHTQTIRRQFADELFESALPFCRIGAWRVKLCLKDYIFKSYHFTIAVIFPN